MHAYDIDDEGPVVRVGELRPLPRLRPLEEIPDLDDEAPLAPPLAPLPSPVSGQPFVLLEFGTVALPRHEVAAITDETREPSWWAARHPGEECRLLASAGGWATMDADPREVARWGPSGPCTAPVILDTPDVVDVALGRTLLRAVRGAGGTYSVDLTTARQWAVREVDRLAAKAPEVLARLRELARRAVGDEVEIGVPQSVRERIAALRGGR